MKYIKLFEQEDYIGDVGRFYKPMEDNRAAQPHKYNYMLLGRLQTDCDYFLGNGNGSERNLWAFSVEEQIKEMKKLWNLLPVKPQWLSYEQIENYEKEMLLKKNDNLTNF